MNTLSYLSSLLTPSGRTGPAAKPPTSASPVASTSTLPSPSPSHDTAPNQDTENDTVEGETVYISARRGERPGDRPRISVSVSTPPHLVAALRRATATTPANDTPPPPYDSSYAHDIPLPDSPVLGNDDEDWLKAVEGHDGKEESHGTEEQDKDRKLISKEQERISLLEATRRWPVRLSVRLFLFLRQLLAYIGWHRYRQSTSPLLTHAIPIPSPTPDTDEPTESIPTLKPTRTSSSSFFRRTPPPTSSRSVSPSALPATPPIPRLPPRMTPKTLVLDLDETLIHSTSRPYASSGTRGAGLKMKIVEVVLNGQSTVYTVYKRPWVDFFLRKVSTWYTVIIFTASLPEYADPVIDWLDGGDGTGGMVAGRLFRSDCLHTNGAYVKDLSVVDADLSRVCLVDNSPASYAINQANGIPIEGWINDPYDECLLDLLPMLDSLRFTSDVRRVLGLRGFEK